ncbi:phosphoenolpyruvate synthase [Candidatus Woesearchaeota archaeon]|nr:phosphoenolpyruvate synthase [Candidatus Woesearchaeota archaeon]
MVSRDKQLVLWFDELGIEDIPLVGGKNASLGEMYRTLTSKGVRVPNGFAITAHAYRTFLAEAGIEDEMRDALRGLNTSNMRQLAEAGRKVRELLIHSEFPSDLRDAIIEAYHKLCKEYGPNTDVAVRSSATAEDLPDASFAGQQETFLNIKGPDDLMEACRKCFASLFTNRAISYRAEKGFDHFKVYLSIGVQKMVRSDLACSGVMFTLDTETGFPDACFITGSWGLGENIVQGAVNPDEFFVHKPTLKQGFRPIINKVLGEKTIKMVYTQEGTRTTKNVDVDVKDRRRFCLTDDEVLELARWGTIIEDHYTAKKKRWSPMDIEWAKDGRMDQLFIVQARPETIHSQKNRNIIEDYILQQKGKVLAQGKSVGNKIGAGTAQVIRDVKEIDRFRPGDVLVTEMTDPDWVPIMRVAKAIVTNKGGRTCHAAIISRELGIPCVVGTNDATEHIRSGKKVTVSCAEGEEGRVYEGILKFEKRVINAANLPRPKTKIMMNVGNPDEAFDLSFIPNDGVGLARMEFIITNSIKVHPMALIHFDTITEPRLRAQIEELTHGYKEKTDFFVDKLSQGVATIAAAFYPKDVIVRMSDFKSNEYAGLVGGMMFEPKEENPMIGWRGASRYYKKGYQEGFALECKAMKNVRDVMGLTNLKLMIPFCRTVTEGKKVLAEMAKHGLVRHKNGLQVYVMCEIPANVVLAEQFGEIFDGFSIGSNDLTQLTLGVDRDSALVADVYDERNDAVKSLIAHVITVCKKIKRKIGICGQAPSDYPDFAQFLVKHHIDSISLNPDSVVRTIPKILAIERRR